MTNDERFQALQRLGQEADVAGVSVDDLERLRSDMREEMTDPSHRPRGLYLFKFLAAPETPDGKSFWEVSVDLHTAYWELARETYAECKMLEDDDFWIATHSAQAPPAGKGPH